MAQVSIEKKREEAVKRMKLLKVFPKTIQQFAGKHHYVSISEPPFGAFYWASGEDLERIQKFEKEYNAVVYMVIRSYTSIGKMDSFLYVSDHEDEWADDAEDIKQMQAYAYVYNHDAPDCSEIGMIGMRHTSAAGLARIW